MVIVFHVFIIHKRILHNCNFIGFINSGYIRITRDVRQCWLKGIKFSKIEHLQCSSCSADLLNPNCRMSLKQLIAGSIVQRSSKTATFSKSFFSISALFHAIERQDIDEVRKLITATDININEYVIRGGSRTALTSKMERFVIIVNGQKPLTIITKHSILGFAAV